MIGISATQTYVIFSSYSSKQYCEEFLRKREIPYELVNGKYKGKAEQSYITNIRNMIAASDLMDSPKSQESCLVLSPIQRNGKRRASLLFCDGRKEIDLGDFTEVTKEEAEKSDSYSERSGIYFVAKK